jgi:predicted TPR repeat methyltransferase
MRRRAVNNLGLEPGQVVLDVGCGTGLMFEAIEERIGPTGSLIGIELSPEMLAVAAERVAAHRWENVSLLEAPAEEVDPSPRGRICQPKALVELGRLTDVSGRRIVTGGPTGGLGLSAASGADAGRGVTHASALARKPPRPPERRSQPRGDDE